MIWVGTSGFQYPEWKGKFYPEKMPPKRMLAFYSERFNTTEINYTFRRMPTEAILNNWAAQTPVTFRFSLKAPQQITHMRKLRDCAGVVKHFADVAQVLGEKLGPTLFQLPPFFEADIPLLRSFLGECPPRFKVALEFRHASWFTKETFDTLRMHNAALCVADSEKLHTPVTVTADFAYFRLRDEGYTSKDIESWAGQVKAVSEGTVDTYVYFKHEESGSGPEFAKLLLSSISHER